MHLVATAAVAAGLLCSACAAPAQARQAGSAGPPPDRPQTVLFVGNSFTYGGHSAAWKYRAGTVEDLAGTGVGGVPALFKLFTDEAGLHYKVSLETQGGKTLEWHWDNRRSLVDRAWDHIVLQDLSELSRDKPGDPSELIEYSGKFAAMFRQKKPDADISLTSTWSRPDIVYKGNGPWAGKPITQMAADLRAAYDRAASANRIRQVHPVGQAFNCAIASGLADPDPYDGIAAGKIDLWSYDHYHASVAGYYLEALIIFADLTGSDPTILGKDETAAAELGIAPQDAVELQRIAARTIKTNGPCAQ